MYREYKNLDLQKIHKEELVDFIILRMELVLIVGAM